MYKLTRLSQYLKMFFIRIEGKKKLFWYDEGEDKVKEF